MKLIESDQQAALSTSIYLTAPAAVIIKRTEPAPK
jgi:hypothetical protein